MKKIMFNDRYGLTRAVLEGRKTQTRRIVPDRLWKQWEMFKSLRDSPRIRDERDYFLLHSAYKFGEVVAVAQNYQDARVQFLPEEDEEFGCYNWPAEQTGGWGNKMFVRADLMPHHIRIKDVRVERLQDISQDDCLAEGVQPCSGTCEGLYWCDGINGGGEHFGDPISPRVFSSPKVAYAALIDAISGKGTWERNPYVFVNNFQLWLDI